MLSLLESQTQLQGSGGKSKKPISNYLKAKYQMGKMNNSRSFFTKKPEWTGQKPQKGPAPEKHAGIAGEGPGQNGRLERRPRGQAWPQMQQSRVLSHVNKNIFPEPRTGKLQKHYSHKIITKAGKLPVVQKVSDAAENPQGTRRTLQTPFKLSNSKSQNQLIKWQPAPPKEMKKSSSTMQMHSKRPLQFTFAKERPQPSRFMERRQRTGQSVSGPGPERSPSRSRSRKINLANYRVTRLDKKDKSLQRNWGFEKGASGTHWLPKPMRRGARSEFPSQTSNYVPGERSPARQSRKSGLRGAPFEEKTENLKSDYLASSHSQPSRSHSASDLKKSFAVLAEKRDELCRVVSNLDAGPQAKAAGTADGKRSQSTNLKPRYVQNVFKETQNLRNFSQFRPENQIRIISDFGRT